MLRHGLTNKMVVSVAKAGGTFIVFLSSALAQNQPFSTVEVYGPVAAAQVAQSLGTNITADHEWEFQAASALHITWVRYDCPWGNVEKQILPQNLSGGYSLPRSCAEGLRLSRMYSVHPMLNALFGAPYGKVASGSTLSDSPVGSTVIPLNVTSGSLSSVQPGTTYLKFGTGNISSKHAYAGTLVTGTDGAAVNLASALSTDLPAGSKVNLNLQLYPPVLLAPGMNYNANPSIQAYGRYVHYLQAQVASAGVTGRVSIWNEPTWSGDPWDDAANLFDNPPQESRMRKGVGLELAYYVAGLPPVPAARLDNGYTNKSGFNSLMAPERLRYLDLGKAQQMFASESFHPYGNNPEDNAWLPSCVRNHLTPAAMGHIYQDCTPVGSVSGGNTKLQAAQRASQDGIKGLDLAISETNICRCGNPTPTEAQITRFDIRQFLVYSGLNVRPIMFYRLAGNQQFEWLHSDHSPYPVFTAFQKLMADIQLLSAPLINSDQSCPVPGVESYSGSYPLATVVLSGSRPNERANSFLLYAWQRSYSSGKWIDLPSPVPGNVTASFPEWLRVESVTDTVAGSAVPYRVRGHALSYAVSDNPVQVLLTPVSPTASQSCARH